MLNATQSITGQVYKVLEECSGFSALLSTITSPFRYLKRTACEQGIKCSPYDGLQNARSL
ncbi:MAG: hypothetical protein AB8B38_09100 [Prochlorococcus sp.]